METFLIVSLLVAFLVWLICRWLNRESNSQDEDLQAEDVASALEDPPARAEPVPLESTKVTRPATRVVDTDELQVPETEELSDEQAQALLARMHENALQELHRSDSEAKKQQDLRDAQAKEQAQRIAREEELERQRSAAALKEKEAQEQRAREQQQRLEQQRKEQEEQLAREIARQEAAQEAQRARELAELEEARRRAEEAERRRALERAETERLERERLERELAAQALAEAAALQAAKIRHEAEEAARREAAEHAAREVAAREAAAEAARQEALRSKPVVASQPNRSPEQIVVMVADDSKVVRVKASRLLAKHQYQVLLAQDGTDAVQQMAQRIPDVLITDVEMPGMDGFELTRHVRSDPRTAHMHIIMITGADDKHRQAADEAGVNVLLGKPYEDEDLIAGIERSLNLVS